MRIVPRIMNKSFKFMNGILFDDSTECGGVRRRTLIFHCGTLQIVYGILYCYLMGYLFLSFSNPLCPTLFCEFAPINSVARLSMYVRSKETA